MNVTALQLALDEALMGSAAVTSYVGDRIISGMAPESTPMPYVRYGVSNAIPRGAFNGTRTRHEETIEIFSARSDKFEVLAIAEAIYTALHRVPLTLNGGQIVIGRISLVGTFPDPPSGGMQAIQHYTARSQ